MKILEMWYCSYTCRQNQTQNIVGGSWHAFLKIECTNKQSSIESTTEIFRFIEVQMPKFYMTCQKHMVQLIPTSTLWVAPEHHSIWEQQKALLYRDQRDLQRGASAACHAALMKKRCICIHTYTYVGMCEYIYM